MTSIQPNLDRSLVQAQAQAQAPELTEVDSAHKGGLTAQADRVSLKPFLNKTVSLLTQGIKLGLSLAIKGSLKIAKFTAVAALKVGKAFVVAIKTASENKKTTHALVIKPKTLAQREPTKVSDPKSAQKNLALTIKNGQATIDKQKAIRKDRRDIAALERRAQALKQDGVSPGKKLNQDYTNFEKSGSRLSANATLNQQDKQDIAAIEKRLNALKKS